MVCVCGTMPTYTIAIVFPKHTIYSRAWYRSYTYSFMCVCVCVCVFEPLPRACIRPTADFGVVRWWTEGVERAKTMDREFASVARPGENRRPRHVITYPAGRDDFT